MLEGDLAAVAVEIDAAIGRGIAVGRQRVVGAAGIVAGTLAGILSQEDAAGIDDLSSHLVVVLGLNNEMFGRVGVRERHHLVGRGNKHHATVLECLLGYLLTGQEVELAFHLGLHLLHHILGGADEQYLGVDAVLSL